MCKYIEGMQFSLVALLEERARFFIKRSKLKLKEYNIIYIVKRNKHDTTQLLNATTTALYPCTSPLHHNTYDLALTA